MERLGMTNFWLSPHNTKGEGGRIEKDKRKRKKETRLPG